MKVCLSMLKKTLVSKTAWELDLESLVRIRFEIDELGEVDNIVANYL